MHGAYIRLLVDTYYVRNRELEFLIPKRVTPRSRK